VAKVRPEDGTWTDAPGETADARAAGDPGGHNEADSAEARPLDDAINSPRPARITNRVSHLLQRALRPTVSSAKANDLSQFGQIVWIVIEKISQHQVIRRARKGTPLSVGRIPAASFRQRPNLST
jgi:hypothetical protein